MDHADFRTIYRDHYGFVWSTVRRFGVPTGSAEDVVQDTFVAAFRRRRDFDGRSPRAWLYTIGRHVASNHVRGQRRAERRHDRLRANVQNDHVAPSELAVGALVLRRFLDDLSPADSELFVLSEVDGLTGPELADALGRNLATVYARVQVLRRRLLDYGEAPAMTSAVVDRRAQRPTATAAGWAVLLPRLELGGAAAKGGLTTGLAAWASTHVGAVVTATVLAATILVGTGLVARTIAAPPPTDPKTSSVGAALPERPTSALRKSAPPPTELDGTGTNLDPTREPTAAVPERTPDEEPSGPVGRPALGLREPPPPDPPMARVEAPDLGSDTRLLNAAQVALREGQPETALARLQEHGDRFGDSAQGDARAALQIEALCRLGRVDAARDIAATLLSARPGTPFAERIARSCAGSQ